MKCVICDKAIGKKARTCSAKCRQQLKRSVTVPVTDVTLANCDKPSVTDLELCRYCSELLPALAKPRRNPGACYPCAMKAFRGSSIEKLGNTVYAGSERPKKRRKGQHDTQD